VPTDATLRQEWVQVQVDRAWVHYWLAQVDEMFAVADRLRPVVERDGTATQRARFFQVMVNASARRERYRVSAETVRFARLSLEATRETRVEQEIALARFILGFELLFHDDFDEADATLRAALTEAERIGDVPLQTRCTNYLMAVQRRRGHVAATEEWADRTLAFASKAKMFDYAGAAEANLAWVAWRRGDMELAEARVREALDIWTKLSPAYPYPLQWMALLLVTAIDLAAGRVAECVDHARAMLAQKQQRLPEGLNDPLEAAVIAWEAGRAEECRDLLAKVVQKASELDYL
jgi:tetratricopeptide (TPR) repeat protein